MKNLDKIILNKIALLDNLIVMHPNLSSALIGIRQCVFKTQGYRESVNCILAGEGGTGKSTACRVLLNEMPKVVKKEEKFEKTIVPAFYCEIPSPATIKTVAASLLEKLNDPNPDTGDAQDKTKRLCHLLNMCETKLVLLDEFHHLLDAKMKGKRLNQKVCNWIKGLINRTNVSFCFIGLPEFEPILRADSQIGRRVPYVFFLGNLTYEDGYIGTIIPFLKEISKHVKRVLQLSYFPDLNSVELSFKVFAATAGKPASIMSLIKEAAFIALSEGGNSVAEDDLAFSFDTGITKLESLVSGNPFRMSAAVLANNIRGYK